MNIPLIIFFVAIPLMIFAIIKFAKVYTIPNTEFKSLFAGLSKQDLIDVEIKGPNGVVFRSQIYPIENIQCYDKKGNIVIVKNNPGLEIQFTDNANKKKSMYFDTIRISGNSLYGSPSRYISSIIKTIELDNINKIQLRNIKKGFKYQVNPFK